MLARPGAPDPASVASSDPPLRFGRYRVMETLGEGGMGAVYLAHDEVLEREVALKCIRFPQGASSELRAMFLERFLREGRALARLSHPNVVRVHDVGTEAGPPYLVMERIQGPSLSERLRGGPVSTDEALALGFALAAALEAAHDADILHRDVKPGNVLHAAEGGAWVLADFGIARMPRSKLTQVGQFLGTPGYAPPEALTGDEPTSAGDVYAWGATLFTALTGAPPHGQGDFSAIVASQSRGPARLPSAVHARAPVLSARIEAALDPDPARRPSARALREALAPRPPAPDRRALLGVGALALAVGVIGGLGVGLALGGGGGASPEVAPAGHETSSPVAGAVLAPPRMPEVLGPPSEEDRLARWQVIAPLVNAGEYERARPLLRELLRRYPDDEQAEDVLEQMDEPRRRGKRGRGR